MMYYEELYHYGVKGQKWGVRRFQNKDGTLTPKGKKRYSGNRGDIEKQYDPKNRDDMNALRKEILSKSGDFRTNDPISKRLKNTINWIPKGQKNADEEKKKYRTKEDVRSDEAYEKRNKYYDLEKNSKGLKKLFYHLATEEYRDIAAMRGDMALEKQYKNKKAKELADKRRKIQEDFYKKVEKRVASTYLRDLGFNDTKAGREFIINNNLINIYPDYDY